MEPTQPEYTWERKVVQGFQLLLLCFLIYAIASVIVSIGDGIGLLVSRAFKWLMSLLPG